MRKLPRNRLARNRLASLVATCSLLLWSTAAFAASDGALGLTSLGSTTVSIAKGDVAMITGLGDIALAPWANGQPAPAGLTTACVFTSTGNYQVTASSAFTTGSDFRLSDGINFITYTASWNDGVSGVSGLTGGTPMTSQVGDAVSMTCGGATPAQVTVNITNGNMTGAAVGTYSDTLTLLIAPE